MKPQPSANASGKSGTPAAPGKAARPKAKASPRWAETRPGCATRPRETPRYFPHEANARSQTRTLLLRRDHGMEGYGTYCSLLEIIRQSPDGTMETDYDALAYELHTDPGLVRSVVEDYGLFAPAGAGRVRHPGMDERLSEAAGAKAARMHRATRPAPAGTEAPCADADSRGGDTGGADDPPCADAAWQRRRGPDGKFLPDADTPKKPAAKKADRKPAARKAAAKKAATDPATAPARENKTKENKGKEIKEKEKDYAEKAPPADGGNARGREARPETCAPPPFPSGHAAGEPPDGPLHPRAAPPHTPATREPPQAETVPGTTADGARPAAPPGQQACDYAVWAPRLEAEQSFWECAAMCHHTTAAYVRQLFGEFGRHCELQAAAHRDATDFRQHFTHWLRIQMEKRSVRRDAQRALRPAAAPPARDFPDPTPSSHGQRTDTPSRQPRLPADPAGRLALSLCENRMAAYLRPVEGTPPHL